MTNHTHGSITGAVDADPHRQALRDGVTVCVGDLRVHNFDTWVKTGIDRDVAFAEAKKIKRWPDPHQWAPGTRRDQEAYDPVLGTGHTLRSVTCRRCGLEEVIPVRRRRWSGD